MFENELIEIMALTYRIDVFVPSNVTALSGHLAQDLVAALKTDFSKYGSDMGSVRTKLEKWHQFLNPHARLTESLNRMCERATDLIASLPPRVPHPKTAADVAAFETSFKKWSSAHSEANGLCQAIRMLAPVAAESFVNLILFVLLKPGLKKDHQIYETLTRQHIDERVKNLHLHCDHFIQPVDWSSGDCRAINTIMNRRNDYLHGNFRPLQDTFNVVYFDNKTPLFAEWRDFYDNCFGPYIKSFSIKDAEQDLVIVEGFKSYLISCINPRAHSDIRRLSESAELGFNAQTGRLGQLFSNWLSDGFVVLDHDAPADFIERGAGI